MTLTTLVEIKLHEHSPAKYLDIFAIDRNPNNGEPLGDLGLLRSIERGETACEYVHLCRDLLVRERFDEDNQ